MADENQELAEGEEENLQGEGEDAASGGDYEDVGEGEVTPYNVERKEAALKIQTAHRGARDRRRVKDAKARGDLRESIP